MYKIQSDATIILLSGGALIPVDPNNTDYQRYLLWIAEGNTPEPADASELLPAVCSPWQIRKALNAVGLRQSVESAVAASGDITLKDGWEFATEFRSDDQFVISMGASIGKTADETRGLIQMASTL